LNALARLAGAIVLDGLAFVIWNVAARTPRRMYEDLRRAAGDSRAFVRGCLAGVVGAIFVAAGTVLILPVLVDPALEFAPVELLTLLAALALDALVGDDLRALV
jgi:hypothetical protein